MILAMSSGAREEVRPGKAQRTYARLAAATAAEIAETGSFTAERVAARSGTSPATFYTHFATKDGALAAAFEQVMGALVAVVERHLQVERLLDLGLSALCEDFAEDAVAFFGEHALVFRAAVARVPESRALRDVYRRHEGTALDRYERFVGLGQQAGKIRAGDTEALARALLVMTEGLNNPLLLAGDTPPPELAEIHRALERLLAP